MKKSVLPPTQLVIIVIELTILQQFYSKFYKYQHSLKRGITTILNFIPTNNIMLPFLVTMLLLMKTNIGLIKYNSSSVIPLVIYTMFHHGL